MNDLKFAIRQLIKSPGFTAVAITTLALGIGANTAIFSVVDALMFRQLPYPNSDRLVWVEEVSKQNSQEAWGGHFIEWKERSKTLDAVAAFDYATWTLSGNDGPERVSVGKISSGLLPLLGVQPLFRGRIFTPDDDKPGNDRVVILSHSLWQRRYNSDQDIIGRNITLNEAAFAVIGVMPPDFRFPNHFDLFTPLALDSQRELAGPFFSYQPTVALLKPGVTLHQAETELDTLAQRYETTRPAGKPRLSDSHARLIPLRTHLLGDTRRPLLILSGAVCLVLLIACANVANLLLARGVSRQKELAIRAALGAGRLRLIRQIMVECLALSISGGLAGLLLAQWLVKWIGSLNSINALGQMGQLAPIGVDLRVLGFSLTASLVTGLLFSLLPALQFNKPNLNFALKEAGRGSGYHRQSVRSVLMVSEVALAMVLLVGAGLLIRSFVKLVNVDPGYHAESLLTAQLALPPRYQEPQNNVQFYDQLLPRLASLPGVVSVGATSHLPLTHYNLGGTIRVEGKDADKEKRETAAPIAVINPDFFRAMGIGLRSGRFFNEGDTFNSPSVGLLSESLARKLFPNANPLGKRMFVAGSGADWTTIIGVVNNIRHQGLDQEIEQAVYLNYRQTPRKMALIVHASVTPSILVPAMRSAVHETAPELPVYDVMTMEERLSHSVGARRFNLLLLGGFAGLALLLAAIGIYGVIAYIVTEQTHEFGIRMALGASRIDIIGLILRVGMRLTAAGIVIGLASALGLTRLLSRLLFEITPLDPITFAGVPILLAAVAFFACWLPARRAAHTDPLVALRQE